MQYINEHLIIDQCIYIPGSGLIDSVVVDVGTGSGILAIWSAQASARKVYAVEATNVAEHARELVRTNGVAYIVEVIQGTMEDIVLPEKGESCRFLNPCYICSFLNRCQTFESTGLGWWSDIPAILLTTKMPSLSS